MAKNKQLQEKKRNLKRSALTGRIVNGRDVILCEEAVIYLKKMGYKVINPSSIACIWSLTFIFIILGFVSISSSQILYSFEQGYTIVDSSPTEIKQNEDFIYNFQVYNSSSGKIINNSSLNCILTLYNEKGNLILTDNPTYKSNFWSLPINKENLNNIGTYTFNILCENEDYAGASFSNLEVKSLGIFAISDNNTLYIIIGLFILTIIGAIYMNYYPLASISLTIMGFLLLFNKINLIISVIIIVSGILLAFRGKE